MDEDMGTRLAVQQRKAIRLPAHPQRSLALGVSLALTLLAIPASSDKHAGAEPVRAATGWLGLLRTKDATRVASATHLPFVQGGFSRCPTKRAETERDLAPVIDCITRDHAFIESIPADPVKELDAWRTVKPSDIDRSNRKVAEALARTDTLVGGTLDGDGVMFRVVIAVTTSGAIGALFVEPELAE